MLRRGRSLIRCQAYQCPSIGKCGRLRYFFCYGSTSKKQILWTLQKKTKM